MTTFKGVFSVTTVPSFQYPYTIPVGVNTRIIGSRRPSDYNDVNKFFWSPDGWWNADTGIFADPHVWRDKIISGLFAAVEMSFSDEFEGANWVSWLLSLVNMGGDPDVVVRNREISVEEVWPIMLGIISSGRIVQTSKTGQAAPQFLSENDITGVRGHQIPRVLTHDQFRLNATDPLPAQAGIMNWFTVNAITDPREGIPVNVGSKATYFVATQVARVGVNFNPEGPARFFDWGRELLRHGIEINFGQ